ncbi:MAG: hypothetical protein KQA40_03165 [Candidatus Aenigmarchaeota archaeon]|nr:hypothetical protein [Candidatus Aenigmarchaeota archaeon]
MKKLFLIFLLLFSSQIYAQEIILPKNMVFGPSEISIVFEPKENFSILLEFKNPAEFLDWKVSDYDYKNVKFNIINSSVYKWEFLKAEEKNITLTYKIFPREKTLEITTTFLYLNNKNNITSILNFNDTTTSFCGNFVCETNENFLNCPSDCPFNCNIYCQISLFLLIIILIIIGFGRRKIRIKKPLS